MNRWSVRFRRGVWQVLDRGVWHDTYPTLAEAHTAAMQYSVATQIFRPGSLTRLKELLDG